MAQPAPLLRLIGSATRRRPALSRFSLAALAACVASRYAPRMRPASELLMTVCAALAIMAHTPARAAGEATIEIISKTGVHAFTVELATNDTERSRGLMFRKNLLDGHGMLFDFEQDQPVAFLMRNTYVSLDMIFITGDGRILRFAENAKPLSDRLIPSGGPVRAVLEVVAGTARKDGIAPGDRVTGSIFPSGQ
jgi:uncharacterized protein